MPGDLDAIGVRGDYRIHYEGKRFGTGAVYRLFGTGHDQLPFMALPEEGREFPSVSLAKAFADEVDARAEALIGGE